MKNSIGYKGIMILLIGIATFTSCEKKCKNGTVRFRCASGNPYKLYIDGGFVQRVNANSHVDIDLKVGSHHAKAEQDSGFVMVPTLRTTVLDVQACKESEWVFP